VQRLVAKKLLEAERGETIQQVISLRNEATHYVLPEVPDEVMHHLLFFSCKFFRELAMKHFPAHMKNSSEHYLSLSFGELTTYADKVQRLVAKVKQSAGSRRLVWLLERGVAFDGGSYITQAQFERKYRGKRKILPHLELNAFLKRSEMVRLVAIQAPRNFTADISLRKGKAGDSSLPVTVKRTDLESDYPHLTKELGNKLGKNAAWVARAATVLKLKGDEKYHQAVRASTKSVVHRYSDATLELLVGRLTTDPLFNPYKVKP